MKNFSIVMTISGEEYAHVSCGCEHGGLLGAYLLLARNRFRTNNNAVFLWDSSGFNPLSIKLRHINEIQTLPLIHRDPFDRMLIAQAKVEDMTLVTSDRYIPQYPIKTLW